MSLLPAPLFFHLLSPIHRPGLSLWQVPPHIPSYPPSTHTTSDHPSTQARLVIVAGPASPFPSFSFTSHLFITPSLRPCLSMSQVSPLLSSPFFLSESCMAQRFVVRAVALLSAELSEKRESSEMICLIQQALHA